MKTPISIYIHFPFCIKKCNYCSFYSIPYKKNLVKNYCTNLRKEISLFPHKEKYRISTIYFGGGTPSLIPFAELVSIINLLVQNFQIDNYPEITLEANPINIFPSKVKRWKICGVNRISLGVQSWHDSELSLLGRLHKQKDIYRSIEIINEFCTNNLSLDLIYGIPNQDTKSWLDSLVKSTESAPMHISSYCLSIEKGTYFWNNKTKFHFPDEINQKKMYYKMIDFLDKKNFYQYEISNFTKKGYESKHNLNYWKGGEYVGFGASAHSFYDMKRISNYSDINSYFNKIEEGLLPIENSRTISQREYISDRIILGLRLNEGISIDNLRKKYNFDINKEYKNILNKYIDSDFMKKNNNRIKLTKKALFVSNSILKNFV